MCGATTLKHSLPLDVPSRPSRLLARPITFTLPGHDVCACVCVQGNGGPQGWNQQRGAACEPAGAALGRLRGEQSQLSRRPLQHPGQPCLSVQLLPLCATSDYVCLSFCLSVCLSVCLQTLLVCVYWHQRFLNQYEIRHRHSTNASQQQRRPTTSHAACALLWHAENKHFSFSLCTDGKPGGTGSEQGASCPARPAGPDAAAPGRWTKSHTICPLAAMLQHMVFSDASNCSCSVQQSSCSDSLWPA